MRRLEFEILPPMGPRDGEKNSGSLKDLVLSIPYLVMSGMIPPLAVLNDVFRKGVVDAGMSGGCRWTPFEIDAAEYDELVARFEADTKGSSRPVDTPDWVKTRSDWSIWVLKLLRGVPVDEQRRLTAESERLEREYKAAYARGDTETGEELFVQYVRIGNQLGDLIMTHVRKT